MTIVSKSDFARIMKRSPGAVSQWITSGKISGAALVGSGRDQKINLEEAQRQLGQNLDLGQQLSQEAPVLPPAPTLFANAVPEPLDDDQSKLLRAKREREEISLRRDQAEENEREGKWILASRAEEMWIAELAGWVRNVETWLVTTAAEAVSAAAVDGKTAQRDMAGCLRAAFRELRERMTQEAAQLSAGDDADAEADDDEGPTA